ncbi:hypothetical protein [Acidisoma sp.]
MDDAVSGQAGGGKLHQQAQPQKTDQSENLRTTLVTASWIA